MCGGSKCARVSKGSWHSRSSADGEDVAGRGGHHGRASIGGGLAWHTCKDCVWLLEESRHPVSQTPSFLPLAPEQTCLESWALRLQSRVLGQLWGRHFTSISHSRGGTAQRGPVSPPRNLLSNPFNCNCHLAWLGKWLRKRRIVSGNPRCQKPFFLKEIPIQDVAIQDFTCEGEKAGGGAGRSLGRQGRCKGGGAGTERQAP